MLFIKRERLLEGNKNKEAKRLLMAGQLMKLQRAIVIIAVISLLMVSSGCEKEPITGYYYNFVREKGFERYDGEWTTSSNNYRFDEGLFLLDTWAAPPCTAYGIMLMSLKFEITPDFIGAGRIEAYFYSTNPLNGSTIRVGIILEKIGSSDSEYSIYYQREGCDPVFVCEGFDMNYLHAEINTLGFTVDGEDLRLQMNGFMLQQPFKVTGLTGWLRPYIYANNDLIRFESIITSTRYELIKLAP